MEIREGMKFTIHNLLYSIFSIKEEKVKIEYEGYVIRAVFYLDDVVRNFENGTWVDLKTETDAGN